MAFDVWAPFARRVDLVLGDETIPLEAAADGWWRPAPAVSWAPAVDYGYRLDGSDQVLPDPRSRWQPKGVHGLSRTFDLAAHQWTDQAWVGRELAGSVIYELHLGTFTSVGTLDAAIERLDHLVDLGVNFVEVMPVNAFNGPHGWGYDGVLWFAVHEPYGGPAAFQRFVDACHARGLGVIHDVVYNHLGPSGNYLTRFGPYLSESTTSWGSAVNLDGEGSAEVRRYIIDNAVDWLREFHFDGLRLDAVHALEDDSDRHLLAELSERVDALAGELGRELILIAESDLNDPKLITPRPRCGYGLTAQWNDDYHHAAHVALTGEASGYYEDFDSMAALAKSITQGFVHDGGFSTFRGRLHGAPIDREHTPTWRLVTFTQDHDQIGNRASGDRLSQTLDSPTLRLQAVLSMLTPFTPMLFMGEEWGATTPWQFFTSHPETELADAVRTGRVAEFAAMSWDTDAVPDPQDPATFERSKLDWSERDRPGHAQLFELYRELAALRRAVPALRDPDFSTVTCAFDEDERWLVLGRPDASVALNFSDEPRTIEATSKRIALSTSERTSLTDDRLRLDSRSAAVIVPA